jgi:tetratricopeptide (TPR) repeat protein
MRTLLLFATAVFLAPPSSGERTIRIKVDAKPGEVISGERKFTVTVDSDNFVTGVEFYVGDDLRATDDSVPYEFMLDTLGEGEGPITLTFAAYTREGESAKSVLNLTVNNQLDKGALYHVERANESLAESDWDKAIQHGRVALKLEPRNVAALLVMGRANLGKGSLDLAQKFGEEAVIVDPTNRAALELVAGVSLKTAMAAYKRGTDRDAALEAFGAALKRAATARRESLDAAVEAMGQAAEDTRLALADRLIEARRYSRAVALLAPVFRAESPDTATGDRLLYAQLRAGRFQDAFLTFESWKKRGAPTGYAWALNACLMAYMGQTQQALQSEREALLNDPGNLGVKTMQPYLAIRRQDAKILGGLLSDLLRDYANEYVVNYQTAVFAFMTGDYHEANERFETAMLADPAGYEMLVEHAGQNLLFSMTPDAVPEDAKHQRRLAMVCFEAALEARPESTEAMTGLAIAHWMSGDLAKALSGARAAVAAGPEYAAAHFTLAGILLAAGRRDEARGPMAKASELDPRGVATRAIPKAEEACRYFYINGRTPLVTHPGR